MLVFLVDILVYLTNEEEHEEHLRMVLQVLRECQLYANISKCGFYKRKVQYLGHVISKEGIAMDSEKIEVITDWPTPKNVTNVRYFMGLVGYYRRFIEGFSKISHPITSLQWKNTKFVWSRKCQKNLSTVEEDT